MITITGTPTAIGTYNYSIPLTGGCGTVNATGTITVSGDNTVSSNGAYDISTATFVHNFSVVANFTHVEGISFNNDGTKMFIIGIGGTPKEVNEYSLSTAFNISTASYVQNFSVASEEPYPRDLTFNNDGTKMFVVGNGGDEINEYSLSTAFNISTASYVQNFSVQSQALSPQGITFNNDGTKMYVVDQTDADVNEYSLSTAFDVSTASYVQLFSVALQEMNPRAISFNNFGTKMFIVGAQGDDVNEYSLSTAFDVSSASYVQNFSVTSQDNYPNGIAFNNDGTKMFVVGTGGDNVYEYSLGTSSDQSVCANSPITDITYNTTGATGIGTPTNLPAGVTASWSSDVITISGTPTAAGTFNYSIPLTGGCGTVNATGTITVNDVNTAAAPSSDPTLCVNTCLLYTSPSPRDPE